MPDLVSDPTDPAVTVPTIAFGGFNAFVALYAIDLGVHRTGIVFATFAIVVLGVRSIGSRLPDLLGARRAGALALSCVGAGMLVIASQASVAALTVVVQQAPSPRISRVAVAGRAFAGSSSLTV